MLGGFGIFHATALPDPYCDHSPDPFDPDLFSRPTVPKEHDHFALGGAGMEDVGTGWDDNAWATETWNQVGHYASLSMLYYPYCFGYFE